MAAFGWLGLVVGWWPELQGAWDPALTTYQAASTFGRSAIASAAGRGSPTRSRPMAGAVKGDYQRKK